MSDIKNDEVDQIIEDPVNEETAEEVEVGSEETSETHVRTESEIKDIEKDLQLLDSMELGLLNKDKMERLLEYILEQDAYLGDYNPSVAVDIKETMIENMETSSVGVPDNAIVVSNHTFEELTELNKRLWRKILASQYKRRTMSRRELEEAGYVVQQELKVVLTVEEDQLVSYLSSCMALLDHSPRSKVLKDGSWSNVTEYNDRRIGAATVVNHKDPVKKIMSKLNLLTEAATHLPHSGLVLKLASAGSLDRALLNDNLVASKIANSLATYSHGVDISSIHTNEILVEHAYRQIIDSNIGNMTKETLEENLSILDLDGLYLGLAISMFPTGFDLYRQCIDDTCGNVDKIRINPRRTLIIRKDRLSNSQQLLLTRGFTKSDISALTEYKNTLNPDVSKYCDIGQEVFIKLKVPSFAEYKRISNTWLNYLGEKSMELMGGTQDESARKRYIAQTLAKSEVMMYAHWVEGVYTRDENGDYTPHMVRLEKAKGVTAQSIAVSDDKLSNFLSDLTMNEGAHKKLLDGIHDFIRNSTVSVIGLSKTRCTVCKGEQTPEGEETVDELITYNVGELFFTLLHQKTAEL